MQIIYLISIPCTFPQIFYDLKINEISFFTGFFFELTWKFQLANKHLRFL